MSLLDGYGTADQYATLAVELGQTHLAITDHGNVDGILKFQKSCRKHNITPILGCELYIVPNHLDKPDKEKRHHIVVLIQNDTGLTNLLKMLSIANLKGFHKRPRIDPDILLTHREGLIFTTACIGSFLNMEGGTDLLAKLRRTNIVALEVMPHKHTLQKEWNRTLLNISRDSGLPLVATADCHYPLPTHAQTQEVLLAIQHRKKWTDTDRFKMNDWLLHMRSEQAIALEFKEQGVLPELEYLQAMENTMAIAEACHGYTVGKRQVSLPRAFGHEDEDETTLLWELVNKGFQARIGGSTEEYRQRLHEEMELICRMDFQRYFLIVWELIDWCHGKGIMTGPGRGSVGGSLVAYLLGITDVDPIRYGLIFARFINPERIDLPDIDMDFEDERRAEVRKHLEDCYGRHNVAGISTFLTMKGRGALRDVSRVFGVDPREVDRATKEIVTVADGDSRAGHTIEDSTAKSQTLQEFSRKNPDVFRLAVELEGQVRGAGQHAAAVCICSDDLRKGSHCNFTVRDGKLVANWDKGDGEHMGLMKLDVLGLSALTMLNYAKKLIGPDRDGRLLEFDEIPLDDAKVYTELSQGHSVGCFQIGTDLLIKLMKEMGMAEFNDIVLINALSRPGPLGSGMTDEFIARKRGLRPVAHLHPRLEPYTKDTLGIVLYQEQVMWVMNQVAGLPWGVCDKVRKVMGKSKGAAEFQQFRDQFIQGCAKMQTLNQAEAAHVWDTLASFGSYGFNLSHAVEYSMIGYWTAWLKFNHPTEFMAALLTYGGEDHKSLYVNEARRLGIPILTPLLGVSEADRWVPHENGLYAPFTEVKGIGKSQADKIISGKVVKERKEKKKAEPSRAKGFFDVSRVEEPESQQKKPGGALGEILHDIGADGRTLTDEELQKAQRYFAFNIKDKASRFRRLYQLENRAWADLPEEALLRCELSGVDLLRMARHVVNVDCRACSLIDECTNPVSPSMGRYNLMIIGEAPDKKEDELGIGFAGDSGDLLWPELAKYGINPFMCHLTNVVKCWPSKTRTPGKRHIEACRPIIEDEIEVVQPIVILAMGNTNVKLLTGRDGGITALSGKTEWSDRYGCWICWCVHPAAVLHSPANRGEFEAGIRNFAEGLQKIGGRRTRDSTGKIPQTGVCPYGGHWGVGNNNYAECHSCTDWESCAIAASYGDFAII